MPAALMLSVLLGCSGQSTMADGGGVDSAPGDAGVDAGGRFSGTVTVTSTNAGSAMGYTATAHFQPADPPPSCATPFSAGDCLFNDCTSAKNTPAYLAGGVIDIVVGAATITPARMADGTYGASGAMALFAGGETAKLTTSGDPVGAPAFALTTTAAPRVTIWDPPVAVGPVPISRDAELHVGWLGGTVGLVTVEITMHSTSTRAQTVTCTTSAPKGGVVIAAALLAKMPKGNGQLDILVRSGASTTRDNWDLVFWTANAAVDSSGRDLTHLDATLL